MMAKPERPSRRARRVAIEAAKAQGCVCDVEAVRHTMAGATAYALRHDPWCPLLRSFEGTRPGLQGVIYRRDGG